MKSIEILTPLNTHLIVFDFDGVFTDNHVYVCENGLESVRCSRYDGLGILMLQNYIIKKNLSLRLCVFTKEKNKVVSSRVKKMGLEVHSGVNNKLELLKTLLPADSFLEKVIFLGNDLNDFTIMKNIGLSVAPYDAHPKIKSISHIVRPENGGCGFVRGFIEDFLKLDYINEEDINELISHS